MPHDGADGAAGSAPVPIGSLRNLIRGNNSMVWAPAGYGKTQLLTRRLMPMLREMYGSRVWFTGMTGNSSALIGGGTIHGAMGIGLGAGSVQFLVDKIRDSARKLSRWRSVKCIVLEECSMLSAELFTKLEAVARIIKQRPNEFFGGIRIVLVGDFFQASVEKCGHCMLHA